MIWPGAISGCTDAASTLLCAEVKRAGIGALQGQRHYVASPDRAAELIASAVWPTTTYKRAQP